MENQNNNVGLAWVIAGWITTVILAIIALCLVFHPVLVFGMQLPLFIVTVLFILMLLISMNNTLSGRLTAQRNLHWIVGSILALGLAVLVLVTLKRAYWDLPNAQEQVRVQNAYITRVCPPTPATTTEVAP